MASLDQEQITMTAEMSHTNSAAQDKIQQLIHAIETQPQRVEFSQVMSVIDACYDYTPCQFSNGGVENEAGSNEGSCKLFAFAKLQQLNQAQTLALFGHFYRDEVLSDPEGSSHANIRAFMQNGWQGVQFSAPPLVLR